MHKKIQPCVSPTKWAHLTEKTDVQSPATDIHKMGAHLAVSRTRGGTRGSPEPLLAPNGQSFGGKIATAIPTSVPNVPIFVCRGNQPPWAIKGDSLTPHNTTQFEEKKEKGRVHLRAIL